MISAPHNQHVIHYHRFAAGRCASIAAQIEAQGTKTSLYYRMMSAAIDHQNVADLETILQKRGNQ